jgi:hypothetical protein
MRKTPRAPHSTLPAVAAPDATLTLGIDVMALVPLSPLFKPAVEAAFARRDAQLRASPLRYASALKRPERSR